ncbi:hypothetical protein F5882DRAFT_74438 [Hyaloscypha sp. PMI_1271]|nr:hypothetical protein F5882DRAFT_74438 [Hyaloscypha sp. PMI_1271]
MSGTKYINVEGRRMKWHLMLKGVVCVANRVNGSKDGLSPVEWDDIQRYGVIRELRVEVFEPVGGGDDRRRRGFGGWHPRAHPDLAFNASFAAVVQTPSTCPRFGPRRQGRRSAELRFSLLRVCDPPCPRNSLPCPALPPLPSSSSQSAKPQLCIECIEAFKCAVRCLRSFADRCTALIPGQKPVQRFHSSQPRLSIQKSALENASDCGMTYSNRTNPPSQATVHNSDLHSGCRGGTNFKPTNYLAVSPSLLDERSDSVT